MTRISGYELLACPTCKQIHRKARYSSINLQVNPDFFTRQQEPKYCANCRTSLEISNMISLGYRDLNPQVPEFLKLSKKPKQSLWQKIRSFCNSIKKESPIKEDSPEWLNYPLI